MFKFWVSVLCLLVGIGDISSQSKNPFEIISTSENKGVTVQVPLVDTATIQSDSSSVALDTVRIQDIEESQSINIQNERDSTIDNPFEILPASQVNSILDTTTPKDSNIAVVATPEPLASNKPSTVQKPIKGRQPLGNFIFWIIVVSLLIVVVVINLKRKTFLNLYRAITNDNYLKLLQREENNGLSFFFLLLYIIFFLNAALFCYQAFSEYLNLDFPISPYLFLLIIFIGIYILRYLFMTLMYLVYPLEKEANQFNFTVVMFNVIVGLLFIPINVLIAYTGISGAAIWLGYAIIAFFYLLRQLRGLFIAARIRGINYFHFFIYLCAFEVAPLVWIISIISNWSTNS